MFQKLYNHIATAIIFGFLAIMFLSIGIAILSAEALSGVPGPHWAALLLMALSAIFILFLGIALADASKAAGYADDWAEAIYEEQEEHHVFINSPAHFVSLFSRAYPDGEKILSSMSLEDTGTGDKYIHTKYGILSESFLSSRGTVTTVHIQRPSPDLRFHTECVSRKGVDTGTKIIKPI